MAVIGRETRFILPQLPKVGATFQGKKLARVLTWKDRRGNMQEVCRQCHGKEFVQGAYAQLDGVVDLYNTKFAEPCRAIVAELKTRGVISKPDFDDPIEWTWWEIWHHEGRRARHGASMQGPDYTWWHGMYEVAKHFYEEFIPQLREAAGEEVAKSLLDKYVYVQDGHLWHRDGMSKEQLDKVRKFYQERYKQWWAAGIGLQFLRENPDGRRPRRPLSSRVVARPRRYG